MKRQSQGVMTTRVLVFLLLAALLAVWQTSCGAEATPTPTPRPPTATPAPGPPTGTTLLRGPTPPPGVQPLPTPSASPSVPVGQESNVEADLLREAALPVSTQRIIVRTVDMTLVVTDVRDAIVKIAEAATGLGGWVVSSSQTGPDSGAISIRVPAERLDPGLELLRSTAIKVKSEVSKSEDFTDEYVDSAARVKNLRATQAALTELLEKAETVDDALKVQTELAKIQEDIEKLQGRLGFLEESVAYSLVRVELKRTPISVVVAAGGDINAKEGETLPFRATFAAPEGVTDFTYTWDFGDGSALVSGRRTAPLVDSSQRATATVSHAYYGRSGSPYIVTVHLVGTGDTGVIEGSDTVIVYVLEDPKIEVYAGEDITVTEGQAIDFPGTFTRPQSLDNFRSEWDFGDGSPPVAGPLEETADTTQTTARHTYSYHRPQAFLVTFRVMATGEAGEVFSQDQMYVTVNKRTPIFLGWDVSKTLRSAVLVLTTIGIIVGSVALFGAVLSPVWGAGLLLVWLGRRWARRRPVSRRTADRPTQPPGAPRPPEAAQPPEGATPPLQEPW